MSTLQSIARLLALALLLLAAPPRAVLGQPDRPEEPAQPPKSQSAQPPQSAQPIETLYLELWRPPVESGEPSTETSEPGAESTRPVEPEARPAMRLVLDRPSASAPIAEWCEGLRSQPGETLLPQALLRGADYERFATESVPLRLEVLIDDVEMRYALGTERPSGASGTSFPFFELCAVGFGSRPAEGWVLDVVHVRNHRGDSMALGLYKGVVGAAERAYLENQFGYSAELPDPAGLLLIGDASAIDTLLLVESASSADFEALRRQIIR